MKNYLFLILTIILSSCLVNSKKPQNRKNEVVIENKYLYVGFDKKTGKLSSMINKETKDNYLKKSGDGNIFRLYLNTTSMPDLAAGAHKSDYGGTIIEPATTKLKVYTYSDKGNSKSLILTYRSEKKPVDVILEIDLADSSNFFDSHLTVVNTGNSPLSFYAAFPYISGICLGNDAGTNLAVNMWDRGYPGIKAWDKPSGGVYGREVAMQWQCVYEPALKQSLAFITLDTLFTNKILTCFPKSGMTPLIFDKTEGGMTSLYFDKKIIEAGARQVWPSSRILVSSGNWRSAAMEYKKWFSSSIKIQPVPLWYKNEVTKRSSAWVPTRDNVAANKASGNLQLFTSYEQLHNLFCCNFDDCMEFAMWNEDVNLWPETYGPWMSSGFIDFRSDLGGVSAFKKGVETCHRYGRRVAMYFAGYGARKNSPFFEGNWQNSAIMKNAQGDYSMDYSSDKEVFGAFNCPGYKPWQDNTIRVCTMLAEAGVDEIRLDEIGFPFRPCFNPLHNHASPYDCHKWMREYLGRVREATKRINPEMVISTEFFMDYFHESTNGALVMDCPGSELDAMKIAMPTYLPLSYHASASEAAITGAVMSKTESNRLNWAWAGVGTEKPNDYNDNFVLTLLWQDLYPTFADALINGEATEWDPVSLNDSRWMGHLWKYKDYWLLTGGHIDASRLQGGTAQVLLPELPEGIKKAYEFNVETREMTEIEINRSQNRILISLKSPVAAVLFPFSECPPLPIIEQKPNTASKSSKIEVKVSLFAPWRVGLKCDESFTINLTAPGFTVNETKEQKEITYTINVADDTPLNEYYYMVTGDCLKAKRWFKHLGPIN